MKRSLVYIRIPEAPRLQVTDLQGCLEQSFRQRHCSGIVLPLPVNGAYYTLLDRDDVATTFMAGLRRLKIDHEKCAEPPAELTPTDPQLRELAADLLALLRIQRSIAPRKGAAAARTRRF